LKSAEAAFAFAFAPRHSDSTRLTEQENTSDKLQSPGLIQDEQPHRSQLVRLHRVDEGLFELGNMMQQGKK
jgi:hypothetical protein